MAIDAKTQPVAGTWDKMATEQLEKKPKVDFQVNIPVEVTFLVDNPREYMGDTGAYYVFDCEVGTEKKVIMTSAWSLLRGLKGMAPLLNKKARITKKLEKGKQYFEVIEIKKA